MSTARLMMIVAGVLEAILAIPILGGSIVIAFLYVPLFIMLVIHVIGLVLSAKEGAPIYGSIFGVVTSLLAWIPFLGWLMHLIAAILLIISGATGPKQKFNDIYYS